MRKFSTEEKFPNSGENSQQRRHFSTVEKILKRKLPTKDTIINSEENYRLRKTILVKRNVENNSDT